MKSADRPLLMGMESRLRERGLGEEMNMNFLAEWSMAIHKAIWFPFFWLTGLESPPVDPGWLSDSRPVTPRQRRAA
jgi:hypothetical protein